MEAQAQYVPQNTDTPTTLQQHQQQQTVPSLFGSRAAEFGETAKTSLYGVYDFLKALPATTLIILGLGFALTFVSTYALENHPRQGIWSLLTAPFANTLLKYLISSYFLFPILANIEKDNGSVMALVQFMVYNTMIQMSCVTTHFGLKFVSGGFFPITMLFLTLQGLRTPSRTTTLIPVVELQVRCIWVAIIFYGITYPFNGFMQPDLFSAIIIAVLIRYEVIPKVLYNKEKIMQVEEKLSLMRIPGFISITDVNGGLNPLLPVSEKEIVITDVQTQILSTSHDTKKPEDPSQQGFTPTSESV